MLRLYFMIARISYKNCLNFMKVYIHTSWRKYIQIKTIHRCNNIADMLCALFTMYMYVAWYKMWPSDYSKKCIHKHKLSQISAHINWIIRCTAKTEFFLNGHEMFYGHEYFLALQQANNNGTCLATRKECYFVFIMAKRTFNQIMYFLEC